MIKKNFPLFSVVGIEVEYMIINQSSLAVEPRTDQLLAKLAGEIVNEVELGEMGVSNEFVLHVIELKTLDPKPSLLNLDRLFHQHVQNINRLLQPWNCQLMPTGTHPWLDPHTTKLWPHGNREIYACYDRIFNCSGHGWANLQSIHINLPFANDNDAEFRQLHSAIRLLLPLIPALAASTPILERKKAAGLDGRLLYYGQNQIKFPCIAGDIIPEPIQSIAEYHQQILQPMYQAISSADPDKVLQDEWLNSRGAIARFERSAIEIRVVDTQESALMDIACAAAIVGVLKYIVAAGEEYLLRPMPVADLKTIFDTTIANGMQTAITNPRYLSQLKLAKSNSTNKQLSANKLWDKLLEHAANYIDKPYQQALGALISHGNLAERILRALANLTNHTQTTSFTIADLNKVYAQLCACLQNNSIFYP